MFFVVFIDCGHTFYLILLFVSGSRKARLGPMACAVLCFSPSVWLTSEVGRFLKTLL